MPSKVMLFNFIRKHGDFAPDELRDILNREGSRQRDAAQYFDESDSVISRYVNQNIVWVPAHHPEIQEVYEHYLKTRYENHISIGRKEAKIIRLGGLR